MITIRNGSRGVDVVTWQRILKGAPKPTTWTTASGSVRSWPITWPWPTVPDGIFGDRTHWATEAWQAERGLTVDGVVGPKTWGAAMHEGHVAPPTSPLPAASEPPFVAAKNFTRGRGTANVRLLVVHTMENKEIPNSARGAADWFAHQPKRGELLNGQTWGGSSAHYCIDANETIQSVREQDTAWHAGAVNEVSIGLEHAGTFAQTPEQWADDYSLTTLQRSAELAADLCMRYQIPVVRRATQELREGKAGFTGHVDVNLAMNGGRGHLDPGPNFPWSWYLMQVACQVIKKGGALELALPMTSWVQVEHAGARYLVAPHPVFPVGIGEAKHHADRTGCELPTPELAEAIWSASDLKLAPITAEALGQTNRGGDPAQLRDHAAAVAKSLRGRSFRLLSGTHKDVVASVPSGAVGLYGWFAPNGAKIQPLFTGHAASWIDYSQSWRPVKRVG